LTTNPGDNIIITVNSTVAAPYTSSGVQATAYFSVTLNGLSFLSGGQADQITIPHVFGETLTTSYHRTIEYAGVSPNIYQIRFQLYALTGDYSTIYTGSYVGGYPDTISVLLSHG